MEPLPYKCQAWRQRSKLQPGAGPRAALLGSVVPLVPQHGLLSLGHLLRPGGSPAPRGQPQPQPRPQRASPAALLPRYWQCALCSRACLWDPGTLLSPAGRPHLAPGRGLFCQPEVTSTQHSPWEGLHGDGAPAELPPEAGIGEEDGGWGRSQEGGGGRDRDTGDSLRGLLRRGEGHGDPERPP